MFAINIKELRERIPAIIFEQGLNLFKEDKVKITNRDSTSVIASVQDTNPYVVRISADDRFFETMCTCSYNHICKHAVATALAIIEGNLYEEEFETGGNWREYFEKQVAIQRVNSEFSQEVRWKLIYVIHILENYWNLNPIKVYMKKDGSYGRTQEPSFNELSAQNVDNTSSDLIVISYLERLQAQQSTTYYRGKLEASYLNFGIDVGELFNLLRQSEIHLRMEDGSIGRRIRFGRIPWRLIFRLEENNNHYKFQPYFIRNGMEISVDKNAKILSTRPIWFYYEGKLYNCPFPLSYSYLKPFIDENLKIILSKNEYQTFISDYLAKLPIFPYLEFPDGIDIHEINKVTGKRIYLEEMDEQLVVSLVILYESIEVPYNQFSEHFLHYDKKNNQIIRVRRHRPMEESIRDEVVTSNIVEDTPGLFYANFEAALEWMFSGLPKLMENGFEVMGEESLVRFKINRSKPHINMSLSSEVDWFDLDLTIEYDGIVLSLDELKRALKGQKKYVKLKNHTIARLPDKLIQKFQYLIEFGKTDENRIRFQNYHLPLIDSLCSVANKTTIDQQSKIKLQKIEKFHKIKDQALPKNLVGSLRDYQKAGYNWLLFLREFSFGGCLADDMGLGKTVQTLALLVDQTNKKYYPNLIITPTSVLFNWQREIEKFTPNISYLLHYGSNRTRDIRKLRKMPLIITTYGHLRRDISVLKNCTFNYIILDESQNIKNPQSETAQAACTLISKYRLTLTGTPVENNTMELWSQFSFLNPGLLGSQTFFKDNFMKPIEKEQNIQAATTLKKLIFPFILRRTKEEVIQELPPKVEHIFYSPMHEEQSSIYAKIRDTYRNQIINEIESKGLNKSRMRVLEGLIKLRQVACHPLLVDRGYQSESGKFEALKLMIEEIISEDHKVLVFSQFVKMLSIIRDFLDNEMVEYTYLDGTTKDREQEVKNFQNDENIKVFLISLKAGGVGLNLTAADYVIHYDPWWNPAVEMQAIDRAHRIGQNKRVFAYKMISKDSVEEKILQLQQQKKILVEQIITTENTIFKSLSKEDIVDLFS